MASGIGQVAVRKHKGHMEVMTYGQTPRGQKYIKQKDTLIATSPDAPEFKSELSTAIEKLFA